MGGGGGGGGAGSSAGSRAGVIWPRHHLRAAPHATAPPHSLSPKRRWTDQGLRLSHTQQKAKLLVIAHRLISTRIRKRNLRCGRKWGCDPWSPWGARIARWRGSSGREGEPVRLMPRSPRRGRAAPRGCSHACAEFLAWQRFFVPFQAYLGHGTPTADNFPNFGHFLAGGRPWGLRGSEASFCGELER